MFSLGRKTYNKALDKVQYTMDSSTYINVKQKEAIGKPFSVSNHFLFENKNKNDVKQGLRRVRAGGSVAPAKKAMKSR